MKILYIDVYFLINFTVDILALYFAGLFANIKTSFIRLLAASAIGSVFAVCVALIELEWFVYMPLTVVTAFIVCYVFSGTVGYIREFKTLFAFIVFETLLGGAVTYLFGFLDKKLYPHLTESDVFNRRLLTLSIAILLAFGFIKLIFYMFSGAKSEKNVKFTIAINDKLQQITGLVDSGNLLIDNATGSPVIIVKRKHFDFFKEISDFEKSSDEELRKRIRFIPASTVSGKSLLPGIRVDYVIFGEEKTVYNMIIALDENEGSFGGYYALVPAAAVCD